MDENKVKLLVVVDYQNDFVDGSLGFEKAKTLDERIAKKVWDFYKDDSLGNRAIIFTYDSHDEDYLEKREGKALPVPHCIQNSEGFELYGKVNKTYNAIVEDINLGEEHEAGTIVFKLTKESFGLHPDKMTDTAIQLSEYFGISKYSQVSEVELVGVVTNICVLSNAVTLQATFQEAQITVDASLCASFNEELHEKALDVMEGLQINVINR